MKRTHLAAVIVVVIAGFIMGAKKQASKGNMQDCFLATVFLINGVGKNRVFLLMARVFTNSAESSKSQHPQMMLMHLQLSIGQALKAGS